MYEEYVEIAQELKKTQAEFERKIRENFLGKTMKILCPYFNGQPYGSSKPKLQGQTFKIHYAFYDDGDIYFQNKNWSTSIKITRVEVLT